MSEQERIEALAEEIAAATVCPDCLALVRAGETCPSGCEEVRRLRYESQGGWGE